MERLLKHKFGIQVRPTILFLRIVYADAIYQPVKSDIAQSRLRTYPPVPRVQAVILTGIEAAITVAQLAHCLFTTSQSTPRT